jgi:hypothetical protein
MRGVANMYSRIVSSLLVSVVIFAAYAYIVSPLGIFWEHEDQPKVYSITWHSGLAFLILVTLSYLVLHSASLYRSARRGSSIR